MNISIITICFNAKEEIKRTFKSINGQTCHNIEWVVVDGNSNDGTVDFINSIIKTVENEKMIIHFISEPDEGIYDAMNKGVSLATRKWCIYMNAGDTFFNSNVLEHMISYCCDSHDIVYGDTYHSYEGKVKLYTASEPNALTFKYGTEFCHQSTFIKTNIVRKLKYNNDYKIAGDYDFFLRAYLKHFNFHHVGYVVSEFHKDGISSTNAVEVRLENAMVQYKNGLISQAEYNTLIKKLNFKIKLRKKIPNLIIRYRHELIMKRVTKHWETKD